MLCYKNLFLKMINLFSIFDPSSSIMFFSNWISVLFGLMLVFSPFWVAKGYTNLIFTKILIKRLHSEFITVFSGKLFLGSLLLPVSLFIFIARVNFFGIHPYIFTPSRHLVFCFRLAIPLWLGHIIYSFILQPNLIFCHLVPLGTPKVLIPLMVLIELIRNLIRPLTLSVRLTANIVAGHILLSLLSSQGRLGIRVRLLLILVPLFFLLILEIAVAFIQAYVFRVLSVLYLREVSSLKINRI